MSYIAKDNQMETLCPNEEHVHRFEEDIVYNAQRRAVSFGYEGQFINEEICTDFPLLKEEKCPLNMFVPYIPCTLYLRFTAYNVQTS